MGLSGKQPFQDEEEEDGEAGAGGQGDNPRHEDGSDYITIECADAARKTYTEYAANERVCG